MVRYHNGSIIRINILIIRISLLIIDKLGLQRSKKKHEVNVYIYIYTRVYDLQFV